MKCISKYAISQLNAGPKAKVDVENIVRNKFSAKIHTLKLNGKEGKMKFIGQLMHKLEKAIFSLKHIKGEEITIIQFPFINETRITNKAKNKIAFIHDLEGIRLQDKRIEQKELNALSTYNYIIAHNEIMKQYLVEKGINKDKILVLELFDYICKFNQEKKEVNSKKIELVYTGNLTKAPFIEQLDENKMNFNINFYGIYNKELNNKKVIYKGKHQPEELPQKIEGNLGLVWDGSVDESDENEGFKNYTKYNNPHKLSCYLAAGIPVVVWKKSAIAKFVLSENIGYTINNIYDINSLDLSTYNIKKENASKIGKRVREGYYTERVINMILKEAHIE